LAATLVFQLRTLSTGYDLVLSGPVRQMDDARVVQVNFKKQVQEWKDILLRGHNPDDLAKYAKQFRDREEQVRAGTQALASESQDAEVRHLLQLFLSAHQILGQKYQLAYATYTAQNFDFKAADAIVRGQDRAPTDLFDTVVERLNLNMRQAVESQRQAAQQKRSLALGVASGLLLLLGFVGLWIVRGILGRLKRLRAVSDRLSVADVSGLIIDVSGNDEIGELAKSMKGVHAAIEELLHVDAMHLVSKP
jgi:methyl-accepting chemotaxis protein